MPKKIKPIDRKELLKASILTSIKVYDATKVLPKILPIDPSKHRYQAASKRVMVWARWKNPKGEKIQQSFGTLYEFRYESPTKDKNSYWIVESMSGNLDVIAWANLPELQ